MKVRLRRIATATVAEDLKKSINDLMNWDMFKGKLKKWFMGTYNLENNLISNFMVSIRVAQKVTHVNEDEYSHFQYVSNVFS